MKRLPLLLLVAVVWLLAGCSKQSLVGTWTTEQNGMSTELTFNADGTFSQSMNMGAVQAKAGGNYELKDKQLTLSNLKVDSLTGLPKAQEAVARQMAEEQLRKGASGTVEFKSGDEVALTIQGQTVTLKRKAS